MIVDSNFRKCKNTETYFSTGMSSKENIDNAVNIFKKIAVVLS